MSEYARSAPKKGNGEKIDPGLARMGKKIDQLEEYTSLILAKSTFNLQTTHLLLNKGGAKLLAIWAYLDPQESFAACSFDNLISLLPMTVYVFCYQTKNKKGHF